MEELFFMIELFTLKKIYIGQQSFTKTICFASFLFIMNVHIHLLDTVRLNGYTIYSTQ